MTHIGSTRIGQDKGRSLFLDFAANKFTFSIPHKLDQFTDVILRRQLGRSSGKSEGEQDVQIGEIAGMFHPLSSGRLVGEGSDANFDTTWIPILENRKKPWSVFLWTSGLIPEVGMDRQRSA